jgi:hypothetical protein
MMITMPITVLLDVGQIQHIIHDLNNIYHNKQTIYQCQS